MPRLAAFALLLLIPVAPAAEDGPALDLTRGSVRWNRADARCPPDQDPDERRGGQLPASVFFYGQALSLYKVRNGNARLVWEAMVAAGRRL